MTESITRAVFENRTGLRDMTHRQRQCCHRVYILHHEASAHEVASEKAVPVIGFAANWPHDEDRLPLEEIVLQNKIHQTIANA